MKFTQIACMHSELIALSESGKIHQWRWCDVEPYSCSSGAAVFHPKDTQLGLTGERVVAISACKVRASCYTESSKVATWVDETLNVVAARLDHPLQTLVDEEIVELHTSLLFSVVRTLPGTAYWWYV